VDATAFVTAHTRLAAPPAVPELRLHLAADVVTLWERDEDGAALPYWAVAWAGGQALARHVLDRPALVAGRTVLDIAAGSGLVALAAARAGAAAVTASETDRTAVAALRLNAAANGIALVDTAGDLLDTTPAHQVVLAGDAFYEAAMAARVQPFLERAAAAGATVLVGDPGRAYLPRARYRSLARYDIPVPTSVEATDTARTTVWQLVNA
jgi:predicted nicotinamide N-methyase